MATKAPFKFWPFFFSLKGRVSRSAYAAFEVPATGVLVLMIQMVIPWLVLSMANSRHFDATLISQATVLTILLGLGLAWPRFAILTKRLHDVGLPWYWAMVVLLPIVVGVFVFFDGQQVAMNGFQPGPFTGLLQVAKLATFWLSVAVTVAFCFVPPRPQGGRYGPDPRRPSTPDVF